MSRFDPITVKLHVKNYTGTSEYVWFEGKIPPGYWADDSFQSNAALVSANVDTYMIVSAGPFYSPPFPAGLGYGIPYSIRPLMNTAAYLHPVLVSGQTLDCYFLDTTSGGPTYTLEKLSGDRQRGRLNECLNDTVLYKIRVRFIDSSGVGKDNMPVAFTTNKGYFLSQDQNTHTVQGIAGIAEAVLCLNAYSSPEDSFDYVITVTSDSAPNSVAFKARCAADEEASNIAPYTHKLYSYPNGLEIKGDIIADGQEPGNIDKNIKLEIDYDPNVVNETELATLLAYTLDALESAKEYSSGPYMNSGIKVEMEPVCGTVTCPDPMTEEETRNILSQTREHNDHIHCLIATELADPEPPPYGMAFGIFIKPWDINGYHYYDERISKIGYASSGSSMQDSLNRCGAVIFADYIRDVLDTTDVDFCEYTGMCLAHEIGHCLQMGHTDPDSFGKNFMSDDSIRVLNRFELDSFNFFNIKSLDDALTTYGTPQGPIPMLWALSTREQIGMQTAGFTYFDKEGGRMFRKPLILLTGLGLLNAYPLSIQTLGKILEYPKNVFYKRAEVLVNFEYNNRIGVAWFEMGETNDKTATYNFNYMRFDENGKILADMRNFKITPANLEAYGIDWERSIPTLHYITDEKGNSWLIYSYSEKGWHIGWLQVDSMGRIVVNKSSILPKPTKPLNLVASPDDIFGFHLFWISEDGKVYYYNPQFEEATRLSKKTFFYTETAVELSQSHFLLISPPNNAHRSVGPDSLEYRIISDKGKLIKERTLQWQDYVVSYWRVVNIPSFYKTFKLDSIIYCLFPYENRINLITFTPEGEPIKPNKSVECTVRETDQMPDDTKRFMKIYKGTIYYFGFDNAGNLYYWNSKQSEE